jgi:putative ABC transport system permease protein
VGQSFEISRIPFTIVGVFKEAVDDMGNSEIEDQTVLIPQSVARYFTGSENVQQIYFSMRSMDEVTDAAKEIKRVVSARHRPDSVYNTQTLKEYLTIAKNITSALTLLLVAVACVTLAVGGVGIMNIMLAGVRARVREIGIRKALGAKQKDLMRQFLIESALMSTFGGAIGIVIGTGIAALITMIFSIPVSISIVSIILGLLMATGTGIFFGVYPASKAAKLDPIVALRSEM